MRCLCVDQTFRVTPAMEAGASHHVRSIEEILALWRQDDGHDHLEPQARLGNRQSGKGYRRAAEDPTGEARECGSDVWHRVESRRDSDGSGRSAARKLELTLAGSRLTMSIYATLWRLQFPRHGDAYIGCEW